MVTIRVQLSLSVNLPKAHCFCLLANSFNLSRICVIQALTLFCNSLVPIACRVHLGAALSFFCPLKTALPPNTLCNVTRTKKHEVKPFLFTVKKQKRLENQQFLPFPLKCLCIWPLGAHLIQQI